VTEDRFGAAGIRQRVLAAWTASPARFREDANAEEDLVLGGYRDRLVVELAQNAADAAARSGRPGRLLLSLTSTAEGGVVLVAANTGAHLDAAGVQALATLRASAKREGDTIGRFGVGFAAVLAVSDDPAVVSRSGGVRFSAADTRQLLGEAAEVAPGLADELTRRDGEVPVLRLPFAAEGTPPDGYDTAVLLPLRDRAAEELVDHLLDEVSDVLLLAMPALTEIVVDRPGREPTRLADAADRWHVLRRHGHLPADVLATRPVEERSRSRWEVTWALPRQGPPLQPSVVYAPTPSDEPLPWPALLIATLPLDPSRRHVAPGPVTDTVVTEAAAAYAHLLADRAGAGAVVWPLVVPGLPAGVLDGALRRAVHGLLPGTPILASAEDPAVLLRPRDAVALTGSVGAEAEVVGVLSVWVAGLVLAPRAAAAAFELLGVRRLAFADVVESLPLVDDPARWREVYATLAPVAGDEQVREALTFLPVPLADGTVVRGVRGLLTSTSPPPVAAALAVLGARVVHPDAVHSLLERLGAAPAGPRALLELPAVRAAVDSLARDWMPPDDQGGGSRSGVTEEDLVEAVLTLVAAAVSEGVLEPGDLAWLGDLPLPDESGEATPAAALALPGSNAARWFADDEIGLASSTVIDRWGGPTLVALGVLDGPGVLRAFDVPVGDGEADGGPAAELDGWDDWCALIAEELAGLPPGAVVSELVAVRDLDAVRRDALPELVAAIAADPVLRPALVTRARIVAEGRRVDVPPYTAWWLREELSREDGRAGVLAGPDAEDGLRALLPAAPDWLSGLDPAAQRALGVVHTTADLDAAAVPGVLEALADDGVEISALLLSALLARLAELAGLGLEVPRPQRVRGLDLGEDGLQAVAGGGTCVVAADRAVVLEAPMYRQRPDLGIPLPAPAGSAAALADLLDLPLAGELAPGEVDEDAGAAGVVQPTAAEVAELLPQAPPTWCEHDELVVDGVDVDWWVTGVGPRACVHAATPDGLARGLAWAAGRWELRALVGQLLVEPENAADVMIDQVFGNPVLEPGMPEPGERRPPTLRPASGPPGAAGRHIP
jgi:hypothetical protein